MTGMTIDEYRARLGQVREERAEVEKAMLNRERHIHREYAFSNNTINPGDIIKASNGDIIRVDEIKFASPRTEDGFAQCVYIGQQLTQKLQPRVRPIELKVWQSRVSEVMKRAE